LTVIRTQTGDSRRAEADPDQHIHLDNLGHVLDGHREGQRFAKEEAK
jgi:hypothetical protein